MTEEIKRAVKRFCKDYDFDDLNEIKEYAREMTGDIIDKYWFAVPNDEERCYKELKNIIPH